MQYYKIKWPLFGILFIFLCLILSPQYLEATSNQSREYSLTWIKRGIGIENVTWMLDKKEVGKGMVGMDTISKSLVSGTGTIKVMIPENEHFDDPTYTPAFNWWSLVYFVNEKGYSFQYFWKGEQIPVHQLTWTWRNNYASGNFDDIEAFYLDEKFIGRGEEALKKLLNVKKNHFSSIQFIENTKLSESGFYLGILKLPNDWNAKLVSNGFRRENYLFPKTKPSQ